jgi:hypothetical protein
MLCRGKTKRCEIGSWDDPELKDVEAKAKPSEEPVRSAEGLDTHLEFILLPGR